MKFRISFHLFIIFCIVNFCQASNLVKPIIKGILAEPKRFPYAASLTVFSRESQFLCGGALISKRWILTAAHCVVYERVIAESVAIKLGYTDLLDSTHGVEKIVNKDSIFVHENYLEKHIDLAALKLPENVVYTEYIEPITLPRIAKPYSNYEDEHATAMGWGLTENGSTNWLRFKQAYIISDVQCEERRGEFAYLEHLICINPYSDSICSGDSGSPLVLETKPYHLLIGIGAYTFSTECDQGKPAGFTRITLFLDWIYYTTGVIYLLEF